MKYKLLTVSPDFPPLGEGLGPFMQLFANLDDYATIVNNGNVLQGDRTVETYYSRFYLLNWEWTADQFMKMAHNEGNPDPEFVRFVREFMLMVGFTKYEDTPEHRLEFETEMKGRMSFTRTTCGKYAFGTQIAYESWCAARNKGISK